MKVLKMIKNIYIILFLYITLIVMITDLSFFYMLPYFFVLLILYLSMKMGYKSNNKIAKKFVGDYPLSLFSNIKIIKLLFIILSLVVSSVLVVRFYTGQYPLDVLNNLKNGISTYTVYQRYFSINNLSSFSINKIPYILLLAYNKFILVTSILSLANNNKYKKTNMSLAIFSIFTYSYISLARGTSYEFFEIIVLFFVVFSFTKVRLFSLKKIGLVASLLLMILLAIFLFYNNYINRGNVFVADLVGDVNLIDNIGSIKIFSPIIFVAILFYGYFGFGPFYISTFFNNVMFTNIRGMIAGVLPFGYHLVYSKPVSLLVSEYIDLGVRWQPDIALMINYFGIISIIVIPFILGYILKSLLYQDRIAKSTCNYVLVYFIVIQFISFPIGNFVFVSSSNIIIIFLSGFILLINKFRYRRM